MADIRWNDLRADFSGANQAMGVATHSMSQAGNVFDKLNQTILNERQRAIENAQKDKEFTEKVRQFDVGQDLAERKFGLEGEKFGLEKDKFGYQQDRDKIADSHWQSEYDLKVTSENNLDAYRKASNAIQSRRVGLDEKNFEQAQLDRQYLAQAINENTANRNALDMQIKDAENKINSGTLTPGEAAVQQNNIKNLRTQLTATGNASEVAARSVQLGGNPLVALQDMQTRSAREYEIGKENRKLTGEAKKAYEASEVKAYNAIKGMNLGTNDTAAFNKLLSSAKVIYPNLSPERIVAMVSASAPITNEWKLPFVGEKKFKLDEGLMPWSSNDLRNLDLSDSNNKLAQNLALMAGNTSYLIDDTKLTPSGGTPSTTAASPEEMISKMSTSGITQDKIDTEVRRLAMQKGSDTLTSPKTLQKAMLNLMRDATKEKAEKESEEKRKQLEETMARNAKTIYNSLK